MLFDPFGKNGFTYFNELEINGEKTDDKENQNDYSAEEPDDDTFTPDDDTTEDEPAEDPIEDDVTDYTEVDGDDGTDDDEVEPQATEDNTEAEPPAEDNPEEPATDDTTTEDEPEADTPEDDTVTDDTGTGDADTAGGDGNDGVSDDVTDYTEEDGDDGTDDEPTDDTAGTDDNPDDTTEDDTDAGTDNPDNGEASDGEGGTLQDMEKTLFSDLSPQQMAIKNSELLQNYIDLFESLNTIFDNINKIPKTYSNTKVIEFVGEKIVEMKDMVNYIITTTYITKTYVENMATYKQCLLMLQQINTMLKGLVQKPIK